jgi:predicted transposase YdaD
MTEGARKKALEIAQKMKELGLPDESIIGMTGLTLQDLHDLS